MVSVDCLIDYKLSSPSAMTQKGNNQQQQLSKKGEFKPPKKNGGRPKKKNLSLFRLGWGRRSIPHKQPGQLVISYAMDCIGAKVALLPHLNGMFIMDEMRPCYVHRLSKLPKKLSKKGTISTLADPAFKGALWNTSVLLKEVGWDTTDVCGLSGVEQDLRLRYWQVHNAKGDESKTTCVT
ncbi:hypothetical protein CK203_065902 [Vitis vinifera]|uniref:Uncharacterized protein n=1 Tax=Vitis vinifera TaxID=29760 RepID=A0A438G3V6_VITVI|nr:hypothetical protein CK203_065902 [Vitis vinifera]